MDAMFSDPGQPGFIFDHIPVEPVPLGIVGVLDDIENALHNLAFKVALLTNEHHSWAELEPHVAPMIEEIMLKFGLNTVITCEK